ncbi:hypothetical protein IWZ00DRAFT_104907 [Phyllosticta capitalensis]
MASEQRKKPCRFFATPAGCNFGDSCKFLHQAGLPTNAFTRLCKFLDAPGGCSKGASCTFSHERAATLAQREEGDKSQQDFHKWRFLIPRDADGKFEPLGPELSAFFQTSAKLVDSTSEIRQQVILRLASEDGLARVKKLVEDAVLPSNILQRQRRFTTRLLPLPSKCNVRTTSGLTLSEARLQRVFKLP